MRGLAAIIEMRGRSRAEAPQLWESIRHLPHPRRLALALAGNPFLSLAPCHVRKDGFPVGAPFVGALPEGGHKGRPYMLPITRTVTRH
jgi:hypothetical protein